jgi:hypothetical protein
MQDEILQVKGEERQDKTGPDRIDRTGQDMK